MKLTKDENTQKYILEDKNRRTMADTGGEEVIKGLEFASLNFYK